MLAFAGVLCLTRWCRQNSYVICTKTRWRITACMYGNLCIAWLTPEYSEVPTFTCFRWLFWRTPSTLKLLPVLPSQPFIIREAIEYWIDSMLVWVFSLWCGFLCIDIWLSLMICVRIIISFWKIGQIHFLNRYLFVWVELINSLSSSVVCL